MPRVLIIKTSSMGDIVHHLPVIADLRRHRPDHVIDWVVEEAYVDLVRMAHGVTRVLPVALRRWRQQPYRRATHQERRAFSDALRAERYDLVLDTQGLLKSALIARRARLARGGRRAGFSYALVRESLARLFYDDGYAVDPRMHAIERMRALAAQACGYDGEPLGLPRFELDVPDVAFPWLAGVVAPRGYVVILHATARAEKAWPAERWTALLEELCAAGLTPVLPSGNPAERNVAETLARDASTARAGDLTRPVVAPALSLTDMAALLRDAVAVVGVDTGLLHLAAALDTPTVGLFGATPRWRYAPYWSERAVSLGSFGELGAQPSLDAVADALRALGVLPDGGQSGPVSHDAPR
jgi:heptosyltransferase-1